jgi:hypothetical protein
MGIDALHRPTTDRKTRVAALAVDGLVPVAAELLVAEGLPVVVLAEVGVAELTALSRGSPRLMRTAAPTPTTTSRAVAINAITPGRRVIRPPS